MEPIFIEPGTTITVIADEHAALLRLDVFLSQQIPGYSRTFFQELVKQQLVLIDGKVARKPSLQVVAGSSITVKFPLPAPLHTAAATQHLDVTIVYEHAHFLIINKPAGLTVHSPGTGHTEVTLVDWLITYFADIKQVGAPDRPGIVHRLDKDTSGLMIIARNNYAHALLSELFKNRQITKRYLAIVAGHPAPAGSIEYNIMRHPTNRIKMTHHLGQGREALTHYTVKEFFKNNALIEAHPITGRTHQIRVHCAAIGHGLLGDALYGTTTPLIKRQALHAYSLAFTFDGVPYSFTQEPPEDFNKLLEALRN
jgi:23S rRNA pseudouridine1911/1915/1917 synthase